MQPAMQPAEMSMNAQVPIVQQPDFVVQVAPSGPKIREKYPAKQALLIGIAQLVLGILCVIFQVIGILIGTPYSHKGVAIWFGLLFILAGSFGVVSSRRRTKCWIVTCMVFSILSAIFTLPVFIASGCGISFERRLYYLVQSGTTDYPLHIPHSEHVGRIAINGVIIALALFEAAAAIWASILCCAGVCCGARTTAPGVIQYQNGQPYLGQQAMVMNQANPMMVYQPTLVASQPVAGQQLSAGDMMSPPSYSNQLMSDGKEDKQQADPLPEKK